MVFSDSILVDREDDYSLLGEGHVEHHNDLPDQNNRKEDNPHGQLILDQTNEWIEGLHEEQPHSSC